MMDKTKKKTPMLLCVIVILGCMLLMILFLVIKILAAETIDIEKDASLKVICECDGKAVEGVEFSLYQLASIDEYGNYTISNDFSAYPVEMEGLDENGWRMLAVTLSGYARRDGLFTMGTGVTDEDGCLSFPVESRILRAGLFLLVGETIDKGGYVYEGTSMIVAIPITSSENKWQYDVTVYPKMACEENQRITRKVKKIWNDVGFEAIRPAETVIELIQDGVVFDTVSLSDENNWQFEWNDLDSRHTWYVVEKIVEDYYVNVDMIGDTFCITNSFAVPKLSEDPPVTKKLIGDMPSSKEEFVFVLTPKDEGNPMPEGSVDGKKEIIVQGAGPAEFGNIDFTRPGVYKYTVYEKNTRAEGYIYDDSFYDLTFTVSLAEGELEVKSSLIKSDGTTPDAISFTNKYNAPVSNLPNTGQLWWPVIVLISTGLIMILVGLIWKKIDS